MAILQVLKFERFSLVSTVLIWLPVHGYLLCKVRQTIFTVPYLFFVVKYAGFGIGTGSVLYLYKTVIDPYPDQNNWQVNAFIKRVGLKWFVFMSEE
jgi:hypothetical protein